MRMSISYYSIILLCVTLKTNDEPINLNEVTARTNNNLLSFIITTSAKSQSHVTIGAMHMVSKKVHKLTLLFR